MSLPKFHNLYFPGLISLVFLPILCIAYFVNHNSFQKYSAMPISTADKKSLDEMSKMSGRNFHVYRFRKYEKVG